MKKYILPLAIVIAWVFSAYSAETPAVGPAPIITTVMENGSGSNRVNIVFLSEAYTASMKDRFYSDAKLAIDDMFSRTPYKEYRNFFNVYLVWAVSQDSILSVVQYGETPKTYFGQFGGLNQDWITIDTVSRSFFSEKDPIVSVLVSNDPGSAGEAGQTTKVSLIGIAVVGSGKLRSDPNSFVPEMYASSCAHEVAHALAGLQDEYKGLFAMKPGQTEGRGYINVTTQTNPSLLRWKYWMDETVPIPTPSTEEYIGKVGLFEGGNAYANGWYRPQLKCTMGSYHPDVESRPPFCKVCREAIVKAVYKYVNPIAEFSFDVGDNTTTFAINPPEPTDHPLVINWKVDGVVIATGLKEFPVTDTEIGYGRHTLSVEVADPTEFVRYDPDKLLVKSKEWDVISIPLPDFTGDGMVDFNDFFEFADYFGRKALTKEVQKYDLNWDGKIDFGDFFLLADSFGKKI